MAKSSQVHLSHLVELQCLRDLEDLPGDVNVKEEVVLVSWPTLEIVLN